MRLREILISEDDGGTSVATTSADIATVAYPLLVRGKNKKERRKNARAAVGQSYTAGPTGVGTGVYENQAKVGKQAMDYKRSNRYPDGEAIPASLPPRYQPASFPGVPEGQKCSSCMYYDAGSKKCSKFTGSPVVKPAYWCLKWEPVDQELTEVSDATLKNYKRTSAGDAINRQNIANRSGEKDSKIAKRNAGQERAEQKLQRAEKKLQRDVEEAHVLDNQSVIYRLDQDKPMSDTEVLVLGGAGRYTLDGLRNKARKEAQALADDLQVEHGGSFRRAAINIKQLTNTLNTIVAAYNELARIRRKGGRGSRGITDEDTNFIRECMSTLENYVGQVGRAKRLAEGLRLALKEGQKIHLQPNQLNPAHVNAISGMFHLNTDPGYGFYRWAIHVAGNKGGNHTKLGSNAGPFAFAYTDEEEKMIHDAVHAITGRKPIQITPRGSKEADDVHRISTTHVIDWKKVK